MRTRIADFTIVSHASMRTRIADFAIWFMFIMRAYSVRITFPTSAFASSMWTERLGFWLTSSLGNKRRRIKWLNSPFLTRFRFLMIRITIFTICPYTIMFARGSEIMHSSF